MTENYFVECGCGIKLRVELFEAGTTKLCPSCKSEVRVPSSTKLKELSGDKYPLLRPIEKIQQALSNREPPFDGQCHGCDEDQATYQVPVTLSVMVERSVNDEGGLRPTVTGNILLYTGAAEELWQSTTLPLLLCPRCHLRFQAANFRAKIYRLLKTFSLLVLGSAFLCFAYFYTELIAALAGVISLIGAIAWMIQFRHTKKLDPFVNEWLCQIRWVPEALAAEDEFQLSVGESSLFTPREVTA